MSNVEAVGRENDRSVLQQQLSNAECHRGFQTPTKERLSIAPFFRGKAGHLALLPQGQAERYRRVQAMIDQADAEGFGSCSNEGECEAVCPKEIPISNIARMTRDYLKAMFAR